MIHKLIEAASKARDCAYAPYSQFKVGAALITSDGQIFSGANVENASYGLTVCAERVAIFNAVTKCCRDILALAVVTDIDDPASPCGACRQVLAEFGPDIKVIIANTRGKYKETTVRELLPYAFEKKVFDRD
jgi:cytidine deaminase